MRGLVVRLGVPVAAVVAACGLAPAAVGAGDPSIAALQVALHARGLYGGSIDGMAGHPTTMAVRRFQRRAGLTVDGIVGPRTRAALGRYGLHALGSRELRRGESGWDVAELQFELAWHGFPSATIDGRFGPHTLAALRRFQRWAGLSVDGRAGQTTVAALGRPLPTSPIRLAWPLAGPVGSPFGPRGDRFHAGIDVAAPADTPVAAAAGGRVSWAGQRDGWGLLVVVAHGHGVRTFYAHLARADVRLGEPVGAGQRIGLVGATGDASGPHLHFEVRLRGAAVDPLAALPASTAGS
jgi:peptidoglycan hydrolase-like protein with peptidoglycan-binding domain